MIETLKKSAPLNAEKCNQLADKLGKSAASIRAKAISLGIEYQVKQPQTKNGKPVTKKDDLVAKIAVNLGVSSESIESMASAKKDVLELLVKATEPSEDEIDEDEDEIDEDEDEDEDEIDEDE
jgi:hypothetical protein